MHFVLVWQRHWSYMGTNVKRSFCKGFDKNNIDYIDSYIDKKLQGCSYWINVFEDSSCRKLVATKYSMEDLKIYFN